MHITVLTLFPEMFDVVTNTSILKHAQEKNAVTLSYINIRNFATDNHKSVDDTPYGGGDGMILRVDVVDRALAHAKTGVKGNTHTVLLDPSGTTYTQETARTLVTHEHLILVCGRYEGIDERIRTLVDAQISIGDYVLTGGEIAAMAIIDSTVRLLPNVLSTDEATMNESFSLRSPDITHEHTLLEYPQYTRPQTYNDMDVPEVLLSGNHADIHAWRTEQAVKRTRKLRPDLLSEE